MKNILIILFGTILSFQLVAQTEDSAFKLISEGKYDVLNTHLSSEIELLMPDDADFYSANETLSKLKGFFNEVQANQWKEKHIGGTKGGMSTYSVGNFKSFEGVDYRLYIVKEEVQGSLKIISIEIEEI